MTRVSTHGFAIDSLLYNFVETELLPAIGTDSDTFWSGLSSLLTDFSPRNEQLLQERAAFQKQLDDYHQANPGPVDPVGYEKFLTEIGYLVEPSSASQAEAGGVVDDEVGRLAGPQLVVPVTNARYAINAVNARWGSLYDALYGSNVLDDTEDSTRKAAVVRWSKEFLDQTFPLATGTHGDVSRYSIENSQLIVEQTSGQSTALTDAQAFIGWSGDPADPDAILLRHHGLHVELRIDRRHPVGAADPAGLCDIHLESATTAIIDFEDAVSIVDASDKVHGYRNWLGLNTGDIEASFTKDGRQRTRRLHPERRYHTPNDDTYTVPGRALMFTRNVGLHLTTDMIVTTDGRPVPESLVDLYMTTSAALAGIHRTPPTSRHGNIYIVRPKMHGPDEVQFVCDAAAHVERVLTLPAGAIKLGVMDEERRTSLNLAECLTRAGTRLAFVNTGFLDRTGSEIRSNFYAGAYPVKSQMKSAHWYQAYEDFNVDTALHLGLAGHAQIGKGMWTYTDDMRSMLATKGDQLRAGATTGWVPSPTAATLHAVHYHQVDIDSTHAELIHREPRDRSEMLASPAFLGAETSHETVLRELDNYVQSILGYVVRWIDLGVGSSKIPDLDGIALMEDRATLRISSQLIANWLAHDIISETEVRDSLQRMAAQVDQQNADEPGITTMSEGLDTNIAWSAAAELIFAGPAQPDGYPEFVLYRARRAYKHAKRRNTDASVHCEEGL